MYSVNINFICSNDTQDMWLENEPALQKQESCMVGVLNSTALQTKMDRCLESLHNFVCITDTCDRHPELCQQLTKTVKIFQESLLPKLDLR